MLNLNPLTSTLPIFIYSVFSCFNLRDSLHLHPIKNDHTPGPRADTLPNTTDSVCGETRPLKPVVWRGLWGLLEPVRSPGRLVIDKPSVTFLTGRCLHRLPSQTCSAAGQHTTSPKRLTCCPREGPRFEAAVVAHARRMFPVGKITKEHSTCLRGDIKRCPGATRAKKIKVPVKVHSWHSIDEGTRT